jgi:inner membrane transporter RhtA
MNLPLRSTLKGGPIFSSSLVMLGIISVQFGAALAKNLFPVLGTVGSVGLRVCWAAVILLAFWRPRLSRAYSWSDYRKVGLFGLMLAGMNFTFYSALNDLPLGVAATIEFIGPLLLAVVQSRKALDLLWVFFAACGLVLFAPIHELGGTNISLVGIGFALLAGGFWVAYILLSANVGRIFPGGAGLAFSTVVAAILLLPLSIPQAVGGLVAHPFLLLVGAGVGLLSSAIPYSLEMEALRYLSSRVFSILLSLEPAVAALAGFLVLHESLTWQALVAIVLICVASAGVVFSRKDVQSSEK